MASDTRQVNRLCSGGVVVFFKSLLQEHLRKILVGQGLRSGVFGLHPIAQVVLLFGCGAVFRFGLRCVLPVQRARE